MNDERLPDPDREGPTPDSEREKKENGDDAEIKRDDPQHQGSPTPEQPDEPEEPSLPDELQVP